jgi:thiol-disulfide isomerase/thioredoxin
MVLFAALSLCLCGCQGGGGSGPVAPDFTLQDLSGKMTSLSQFAGKVIILDFWATWCPPCRMSIPELVKLQERYAEKGLVVIGISLDDPLQFPNAYLNAFKEKFKINYQILRYNGGVIGDYFGSESPAIPTLFVIDRELKIRDKLVGFSPGALQRSLEKLMG